MSARARGRLIAAARWGLDRGPLGRVTSSAARALHAAVGAVGGEQDRILALEVVEHPAVAVRTGVLEPAAAATVAAPRAWDTAAPEPLTLPGRPLAWSLIEDVELNDTSLVRHGRSIVGQTGVMEDMARGLRFKGPGLIDHTGGQVLAATSGPARRIAGGIRLCGFGSGNWYHWIVDILPTALLVDALPDDLRELPLLVPELAERRPAWRAALDATLPDHPTLAVPRADTIAVDRLVWLDPAVNGPRTLRDEAPVELDLLAPALGLLGRFRETVLGRLRIVPVAQPGRRVLLVRPPDAKRSANQTELVAVAREQGFEAVDPGTLTFADQVRLFAEAEVVAGGWGAAWSSMLFAAPTTRALMWKPALFADWPLFSNLTPVSGMTLRHLAVRVEGNTLLGANSAEQHVPPDTFARALASVLRAQD